VIPLFKRYPSLHRKLPYISLADLPTPVQRLNGLGEEIGADQLYIKRDDLAGEVYGGNKIRKLEFLLGDALRNHAREVITFGAAGSNHALATAIYARQVGLKTICMLMPQQNSADVRRNLLMSYASGAELHHYPKLKMLKMGTKYQLLRHRLTSGKAPYIIPFGGCSVLGTVSFVNAALELKEQIELGLMPRPTCIYVALGSTGSAVGLIIGLKIANLKTRVISVCTVYSSLMDEKRLAAHFAETVVFLNSLDLSFPTFELSDKDTEVVGSFLGKGYTHYTEEGMAAVRRMAETDGIKLDGTYTGKTVAALLSHAADGKLRDKAVLFWNTLNSKDISETIANIEYRQLPRPFHRYFEKEVQPLDI